MLKSILNQIIKNGLFSQDFLSENKDTKISLNLYKFYEDVIINKNDTQPGNINVLNFLIIQGSALTTEDGLVTINDENAIYQKIALSDYDPADMVYVDCGDGKIEGSGTVEVDEYTANDMRFTVNAVSDSYLVVSSAYYPGWKASIDGSKGKDVNKANSALLAVRVPAGEHKIKVYYDQISFKSGAVVSGISFIIWLGLLFTKIGPNRAKF